MGNLFWLGHMFSIDYMHSDLLYRTSVQDERSGELEWGNFWNIIFWLIQVHQDAHSWQKIKFGLRPVDFYPTNEPYRQEFLNLLEAQRRDHAIGIKEFNNKNINVWFYFFLIFFLFFNWVWLYTQCNLTHTSCAVLWRFISGWELHWRSYASHGRWQ